MKQNILILMATALLGGNAGAITFEQAANNAGYTTSTTSFLLNGDGVDSLSGVTSYTVAQEINVSFNNLTSVGANAFQGLSLLEVLLLSSNQISSLHSDSFFGLTGLKELRLQNNSLTSLKTNQFSGLSNLETLFLGNNQLTTIGDNAFSGLNNLKTFIISNNGSLDTLNFKGAEFDLLVNFYGQNNGTRYVSFEDATLSQGAFASLMSGYLGALGIATIGTVELLNLADADLSAVTDLSTMYTMDTLESLLLEGALLGDVDGIDDLVANLDSLTDLRLSQDQWDAMGATTQTALTDWSVQTGNSMAIPEPSVIALVGIFGSGLWFVRRYFPSV